MARVIPMQRSLCDSPQDSNRWSMSWDESCPRRDRHHANTDSKDQLTTT